MLTKKFRILLAAAVAFLLASGAAAANCAYSDSADQEATVARLRQLYREENFSGLEAALNCLLRQSRFASGHSGSAVVYQFYRQQLSGPTISTADVERVQRWGQVQPPSMFAEMAALRLRYAFAWKVRGGGYASQTPEANWKMFHHAMQDTEEALYRASAELQATAIWHQLLLAVAGDTTPRRADMEKVFQDSVKQWPNYYDFHEVRLTRLVPRWGGSWQQVDQFIQHYANQREGVERDTVYARFYAAVMPFASHPSETQVDWPRLKRGLEDLVTHYPDRIHRNLAASFACAYADDEYASLALPRVPAPERKLASWVQPAAAAKCSAR